MNNLIGLKFNKLTVINKTDKRSKGGKVIWYCKCDCGLFKEVQTDYLTTGQTKSCGCLKKELTIKRNTKHGLRYHPLYYTWLNIRSRCYNKNNSEYKNYGERGIKICDEWNNFYVL